MGILNVIFSEQNKTSKHLKLTYFQLSQSFHFRMKTALWADSGAVLLGLNVVAELPLPQQQQDPAQVLTLISVLNTVTIFFSFLTTYPVNLILIRSLSSISWYLEPLGFLSYDLAQKSLCSL